MQPSEPPTSTRGLRRLISWVLGLGLAAVLAAGGMLAWTLGDRNHGADPTNPEQVALGRQVYAARCASCHGDQLQGQPNWQVRQPNGRLPAPPHDESGHTWHHPDTILFSITQRGAGPFAPPGYQSDMPAFGDTLTDEEIWAVLAFIKSSWSDEARRRQTVINERAQHR